MILRENALHDFRKVVLKYISFQTFENLLCKGAAVKVGWLSNISIVASYIAILVTLALRNLNAVTLTIATTTATATRATAMYNRLNVHFLSKKCLTLC